MGRGVRTVQRWESELGLPVHRVGRGPRSPVHAFTSELSAWMLWIEHSQNGDHHRGVHLSGVPLKETAARTSAVARVLVQRSSGLVQQLVNSMWEQQRRTEEMTQTLDKVQKRLQALRKRPTRSRKRSPRKTQSPRG